MSGVTDFPYREIVKKFKPGLVFSEMIASRALIEKNLKTLKMIKKLPMNFMPYKLLAVIQLLWERLPKFVRMQVLI